MNSIASGGSKEISRLMGSWSPVSGNTGYCVLGRTDQFADRKGNQEATRRIHLAALPSFESFAFKALPISGQEGLWISAHLTSDHPTFERIWEVYASSFCDFERRDLDEQRKVMRHPRYRFSAIMHNTTPVGLLGWWILDSVVFVEHFAIAAEARSGGFGGRVLSMLQSHVRMPILVDVEPLGSEPQADRRVAFYQRQGFHYCPTAVTLPAYCGKETAPSNLMAWPLPLGAEARSRALAEIQQLIYGIAAPARPSRVRRSRLAGWNPYDSVSDAQRSSVAMNRWMFSLVRESQGRYSPWHARSMKGMDCASFNARRMRGEIHSDA